MTAESKQAYAQKKQHIYAYRRRQSATKYFEKLTKILKQSNNKDASWLMKGINTLWWSTADKLGWYDDIPKRGERSETYTDKIKTGLTIDMQPIAQYICPICQKPGFLFSPNLDLNENELKRYMLHIDWPSRQTGFCDLQSVRRKLILIRAEPVEGILTMDNNRIILM